MAFDVSRTNIEISATDKTKVAFDSIKSSIGNLTSQFGALRGVFTAGAFVAFTKRIIDQADSMNDLSKRTGIAVEQIGAWRLATEQSGTSMDALTAALGKGSKYLVQHGDDLKKIGINAKTSEELILQLSGIISQMPSDDPRRTALAMQVLGKSAGELIPLLSEGEQGLRKMLERGRELNPVTAEMAKNADAFNDNLAEMKLISGGLFVDLVGKILPLLNTYLQKLKLVVDEGDWMDKLAFFSLGYVPGKIADKTEKPEVQIQKYTQRIVELKKELADFTGGKFGYRKDGILEKIAEAEDGLAGQRARLPRLNPKRGSNPSNFDATNLDAFLKSDSASAPKRNAIAERIKALATENNLLAQGVPLEDARTIARLKGEGATDKQIVSILNATSVQNQFEAAEKLAEKTKQDLIKATQEHSEAMQEMLQTADEAVISAQREYAESERNLQVMQLGESAVLRMEVARLQEAAASAEQGLAYARLNGLSQENITFIEGQIFKLNQLAEARLSLANSSDATKAFEKDKKRIEDLQKAESDALKKTEDEAKRVASSIYDSISDSIVRSLDKGEGSFKTFLKGLQNTAKTAAIRLGIDFFANASGLNGLISQVARLVSGGGSAGSAGEVLSGKGSGSIFGQLSSIGDIFKSGNASIVSGIESLGSFLSTGNGGLGDLLGGAIGQFSGTIAKALPFAGAALSLLTGDIKGAIGAGIGAALSFTPLGPIGGIVGSFIGKALGGLFGGKLPPRYASGTESFFKDGAITSQNQIYKYKSAGGNDALGALNSQVINNINSLLKSYGLEGELTRVGSVLNKKKSSDAAISADINGNFVGGFTGKIKKGTIQQAFDQLVEIALGSFSVDVIKKSSLPDGVKKFFDGLTKKEDVTEAISVISSLNTSLADLPPIFNAIKNAIDTTSYETSIADLKTRFAAIGTYTNLFYSAEEQFATFTKQLATQTGALGLTIPKTRDEYRGLVDGINVVDEASNNLFTGLVALAPAMDSYFKQLESQKQITDELLNSAGGQFTTLADYRAFKGISANYDSQLAYDYVSNLGAGNLGNNASGQSTVANTATANTLELLREIRDYMRQNLSATEGSQGALQRIELLGLPSNA